MGNADSKKKGGKDLKLSRAEAREALSKHLDENKLHLNERAMDFVLDTIDQNCDDQYEIQELVSEGPVQLYKASVKATEDSFMGIPGGKRLAPQDRSSWREGDIIEVRSERKNKWFDDGVIVAKDPCETGEASFGIKVRYAFVSAWMWDLNTNTDVFRPVSTEEELKSEEKKAIRNDAKHKSITVSEKKYQPGEKEIMDLNKALAKVQDDLGKAKEKDEFKKCSELKLQIERLRAGLERVKKDSEQKKLAADALREKINALEKMKKEAAEKQDYATAEKLKKQIW
eukprot:CAMPEP_0114494454 /NCGR_PEP_ID=MMETSP0109-20121206/4662_1 /TAXON_ID=29199 /ORGANISM="Chlorarachnion reptans, Strain CCCM449" /LENGTH=284 /DNA_ID=CAMNT_0001671495 /DNA_START=91 /DNA_END=942 /DNA_ORIENTATION=+